MTAPARPRTITITSLLISWLSVSLVFLSVARPVREWAGEGWVWFPVVAAFTLLFGVIAAYALWTMRSWALPAVQLWGGSVVAGMVMILTGREAVTLWSVAGLGVVMVGLGVFNGYVKRITGPEGAG